MELNTVVTQINVPQAFDITIVGKDTTNYQIFGSVTSTTAPAFADQKNNN